ncbi:DUF2721 domain-containing protein [Leptospira biflexa]|jgi:hypothetical protein|uniref:DUF2721 domain-containing protein n=1 Tax=Leptospira biflexa serovar Patoc (strain Patoc 1 / ATCC 23582 / Paris) TaxID=456481 RepID=B0SKI2_LEPBP|nr:DUF2721 domain-containing protein [Leptospira biflexa]ABZ93117.1 Conserved hypothetical protein [Leptospira biflexa serovar Patoc strain 'Patoc 1 (Ames)']ABZ96739.1 Conserved hypothetical protein; putative membrane protein [Leptospira biflexa serovar Patoc strain 'Patoc 1 (Paris)']TGM38017.1 DUF2721 domain-containing protein [Leptospira biflexa]TGM41349.1 DUF2721 domain-containing protein [Leptospira biflexa]TGM47552.1 DUF2721 domain-containing protein [Leptospira biflexa]
MFESFTNSEILSGMITPAVLVSACASLIFSTANRLGRIFDRVNLLKSEVEMILDGKKNFQEERMVYLRHQLSVQKKRAVLIQRSMAFLYLATSLFIISSLTLAFTLAFAKDLSWLPTIIAIIGGICLFIASALLLYESRYNLTFINRQIEFTEFLERGVQKK